MILLRLSPERYGTIADAEALVHLAHAPKRPCLVMLQSAKKYGFRDPCSYKAIYRAHKDVLRLPEALVPNTNIGPTYDAQK
ncbi:hypothetical protein TNCV_4922441 [Trichonephila clavipes]|nr:hypothetical protein TNCV_4922441 [Trichonephila clavipes]